MVSGKWISSKHDGNLYFMLVPSGLIAMYCGEMGVAPGMIFIPCPQEQAESFIDECVTIKDALGHAQKGS